MKLLIFAVCFAAALAAGFFSVIGLYIAAGLLAVLVMAAIENLADNYKVKVSYKKFFLAKSEAPTLIFDGKKRLRGEVVCQNMVTGDISRTNTDIRKDRTLTLPPQDKCGTLLIRYFKFYRYDLLGLTKRLAVCYAEDCVTVLPDAPSAELEDIITETTGGEERDGAREARPDEPWRRVNLKLTHRFGKPYINTYSPDKKGELWLAADCGHGDRADIIAEKICGIAQILTSKGMGYNLALPDTEGGIRLLKNTDSENVQREVLTMPLYNTNAHSIMGRLTEELDNDAEILAFTANDTVNDERITIIN